VCFDDLTMRTAILARLQFLWWAAFIYIYIYIERERGHPVVYIRFV